MPLICLYKYDVCLKFQLRKKLIDLNIFILAISLPQIKHRSDSGPHPIRTFYKEWRKKNRNKKKWEKQTYMYIRYNCSNVTLVKANAQVFSNLKKYTCNHMYMWQLVWFVNSSNLPCSILNFSHDLSYGSKDVTTDFVGFLICSKWMEAGFMSKYLMIEFCSSEVGAV